jgi:release factor glutamine methyltransferase
LTLNEYLKEKTALFARCGIPEAEEEAWILFMTLTDMNKTQIRFSSEKDLFLLFSKEKTEEFDRAFLRRAEGEPIGYIVGHAPFYDLEFSVGEGVLIPRFDTEILVESALIALGVEDLPVPESDGEIPKVAHRGQAKLPAREDADPARVEADEPVVILDLCTGTGCVGITIANELRKRNIPFELRMTEISDVAAAYAEKNAETILGKGSFAVEITDLWPKEEIKADILVSNPPYIEDAEMTELSREVRDHEPALALTDGGDGLSFYRRIIGDLGKYVKDGGVFLLEHGYRQKAPIREMMPEGAKDVVCVKDYGGNDRVTAGRWEVSL